MTYVYVLKTTIFCLNKINDHVVHGQRWVIIRYHVLLMQSHSLIFCLSFHKQKQNHIVFSVAYYAVIVLMGVEFKQHIYNSIASLRSDIPYQSTKPLHIQEVQKRIYSPEEERDSKSPLKLVLITVHCNSLCQNAR